MRNVQNELLKYHYLIDSLIGIMNQCEPLLEKLVKLQKQENCNEDTITDADSVLMTIFYMREELKYEGLVK